MKTKWKKAKRLSVIFLAVFLSFIAVFAFLRITIQNKVRQNLEQLLPGKQVHLSSVRVNLFASSAFIDSLSVCLKPDSLHNHQHVLYFPKVTITGVHIFKLIFSKKLLLNKVKLEKGNIKLDEFLLRKNDTALADLFSQIRIPFRQISIKTLEITPSKVWLQTGKKDQFLLRNFMTLYDVTVNNDITVNDRLHFSDFNCILSQISYPLRNMNHTFQVKKIEMDSRRTIFRIDLLVIRPDNNYLASNKETNTDQMNVSVPQIEFTHSQLMNLMQKRLIVEDIIIPQIKIDFYTSKKSPRSLQDGSSLFNNLKKLPLKIDAHSIKANQISFEYKSSINQVRLNGNVAIHELAINDDKKDSFHFAALDCSLHNLHYSEQLALHHVDIDKLELDSKKEMLFINSLKIIPRYGKFEFSHRIGYQADRIESTISGITIKKPNIFKLFDNKLMADEISIQQSETYVFRDRRLPRRLKPLPLPVAYLKTIPEDIRVKKLEVKNSSVAYEEFPDDGPQSGTIRIENMWLSLSPLINHPLKGDPLYMIAETQGSIMGSGKVYASINLPLRSEKYYVKGAIVDLELPALHSSSENLGKIRIKSGLLDSLGFQFNFTKEKAAGKIVGEYHDLIIQQLKKDLTKGKRVARVPSFMLRHLIIPLNKDKTLPERKRTGKIDYRHDPTRFISYYLLQSLLTGIKSSFTLGFLLPK